MSQINQQVIDHPHPSSCTCCSQSTNCRENQHYHQQVNLKIAMIGFIFIIASFFAERIYGPTIGTLSAVVGAIILSLPIMWNALLHVLRLSYHMDVLVGIALLAAIVRQQYQEAGIIAFFMILALALEERTAYGAQKSIEDLIRLTPQQARRLLPNGEEEVVPAHQLKVGDIIRIRPGENFPADGEVIKGITTVNQASITGESLPIDKNVGDFVYAGTENITGMVECRVKGVGSDTTLGKVKDLISKAHSSALPVIRIIDRYVEHHTPIVILLGLVIWYLTGDVMRFVYLLVISCPCALVLATPSAAIAAIASAARLGLLIKNVAHIELAARISKVIFDKTGTITEGRLAVSKLTPVEGVELVDLLTTAAIAESQSNHPVAKAVIQLAKEANLTYPTAIYYEERPGCGISAQLEDGEKIRVGKRAWFEEEGLIIPNSLKELGSDNTSGMSIIYVAKGNQVLGWIGLRDKIRNRAYPTITELQEMKVQVALVSGDNHQVVQSVAEKLKIADYRGECLPHDKVDYVQQNKSDGHLIAVVGDGVNDAPALAAGDIGIAMGAIGSDIAINSASIALMNNDLRRIPFLIQLARKTKNVILLNIVFGCITMVGGIMLFIFGNQFLDYLVSSILGFKNPGILKSFIAAIIHIVGTLLIIFNSARLVRFGEYLELDET